MKKVLAFFKEHFRTLLRLLPRAIAYALPLMFVYRGLVAGYNGRSDVGWGGILLAGFFLSIVGFYIAHYTAEGIKSWLAKSEEEIL
ncbi:MAG: hypothetical protein AAF399_29900 [Bacteroidota bacterium]